MNNFFSNKVVWVTGGSSGIGEQLAHDLAKAGAILVISARREAELKRVATQTGLGPDRVMILPLDLTKQDNIPQLAKKVVDQFGRIDILINNGGISQRSLARDTPISIDRQIMETDYFGTVALTKAVLPYMLAQKSGQIVVVSSLMGLFSSPMRSAYCGAKHAVQGFFESLRSEVYNDGIRITLVCPGFIKTNISINAVTASGGKQGIMDPSTGAGMPVEVFVPKMLKAISRQKEQVLIGGWELRGAFMKRFFPAILRRYLRKAKVT